MRFRVGYVGSQDGQSYDFSGKVFDVREETPHRAAEYFCESGLDSSQPLMGSEPRVVRVEWTLPDTDNVECAIFRMEMKWRVASLECLG